MVELTKEVEEKLLKIFKDYNIESDKYDYKAKWDNKITMIENLTAIKKDIDVLSSSKNNVEKQEADLKTKKVSVKNEKSEVERVEITNLLKEEENSKLLFENSIKEIKENNSDVLKELYDIPREYIKSVATGFNNSLILLGKQGLGKSFLALETLNTQKSNYRYHSGFTSPMALYKLLYENRGKDIINVFDNTNGLVSQPQALSLVLNALYSVSGNREIMWNSTTAKLQVPTRFIYEAKTIFITNELPKAYTSRLILSRCLIYDFQFPFVDIIKIMYEIAKTKHPKLEKKERLNIVDFIRDNCDESSVNFDLRIQQHIENLYLYDKINWGKLSLPLLTKDTRLFVLKNILKECATMENPIQKSVEKFKEAGKGARGFSEREFYLLKGKLGMVA